MLDATSEHALDLLRSDQPLGGLRLSAPLQFRDLGHEAIHTPITVRNSQLESVDATCLQFYAPVTFEGCALGDAVFFGVYFLAGARFINCKFTGDVTFECGGHNRPPTQFVLDDCTFHAFVNFFDCQYEGPVVIRRCSFKLGTNLLGNVGQPYQTTFRVPPLVTDNFGALDLDGG